MLFEDKGICVYIDEDVPCLVNRWNGFIPSYRFREYISKLLDIHKEHHKKYDYLPMLADTRELHVLSPDDISWIVNNINPKYIELGCYHEAFIVAKDICGNDAIRNYVKHSETKRDFATKVFTNLEDAKKWLMNLTPHTPTEA